MTLLFVRFVIGLLLLFVVESSASPSWGSSPRLSTTTKGPPSRLLRRQSNIIQPYRLGSFAETTSTTSDSITTSGPKKILHHLWFWIQENHKRLIRTLIFVWYSKASVVSILDDTWEMDRAKGAAAHKIRNPLVRQNVQRRTQKDRALRKLVGAGYTPRLVCLYGVMLRGIFKCTALTKVLNPPMGWGAGSVVAADYFAHREWLPCILLGWFGSEWYWRVLFGVVGPPAVTNNNGQGEASEFFDGFPITIHKVRFL